MKLKSKYLFFLLGVSACFLLLQVEDYKFEEEIHMDIGTIQSISLPINQASEKIVRIALIDTVLSDDNLSMAENYYNYTNISVSNETHGDEMLAIIKRFAPINSEIDVYSIGEEEINIDLLKQCLNDIALKKYDIINMSFYINDYDIEVKKYIDELYINNVTMVSSSGNNEKNKSEFPASLSTVLSIGGIEETGNLWRSSNYGDIDFVMPFAISSSLTNDTITGTSVSTVLMSSLIAHIKGNNNTITNNDLYQILISYSSENKKTRDIGYGQPIYKK